MSSRIGVGESSAEGHAGGARTPRIPHTNWKALAFLSLLVAVALAAFEVLKHLLFPHLSPWHYVAMSAGAGAITAGICGYRLNRRLARLLIICAQADNRLALERNLLLTVTDTIPDSIFAKDVGGRYLLANRAFAKHHGVESPKDLIGKSTFDLFEPDEATANHADDGVVLRTKGGVLEREQSAVDKSGNVKWTLTTKAPLIDKDGAVVGIVGVHRDITRFKLAEQESRQSEANLAAAQRIAHLGSFEQDLTNLENLEDSPLVCSDEAFRIFGYEPGEIEASRARFLGLVHPEDRDDIREAIAKAIGGTRTYSLDYRIVRPDGTERAVHGTGDVVCDPHTQQPLKLVGTIQDITERKRTELQLQEANQKLAERVRELQQRSGEISLLSELGGWLQSCQTADEAYTVIGHAAEQLFPQWSGALYAASEGRNAVELAAHWGDTAYGERVFPTGDCWALRRGRPHWFEAGGSATNCRHTNSRKVANSICVPLTAQGNILGVLNLQRKRTPGGQESTSRSSMEPAQKLAAVLAEQVGLALWNLKLRETLRRQSIRDPLTGLFNRRFLEESLEREISRANRNQGAFAVILMDLDHFKMFNDTFGHQAGDAALRTLGDFLKKTSRGQDIACRYGGEEFAIVLSDASLEGALQRAEVLREGVRQLEVEYGGQLLGSLSVSVGVALFPDHGSNITDVLRAADEALYSSKHEGRNRVSVRLSEPVA